MKTPMLRITTAMLTAGLAMAAAATTASAMGNGFENEQRREATMERLDRQDGGAREAVELAGLDTVIPGADGENETRAAADTDGPDLSTWTAPWEIGQYEFAGSINHRGR